MATIQTVGGSLDTAKMGQVLMHEHVFVLSTEIMENYRPGGRKRNATETP